MNNETARLTLDIDKHTVITTELLKKQYRTKALIYHPDKNKSHDANDQFRRIHEAYKLLSENNIADVTPLEGLSISLLISSFVFILSHG